MASIKFINRLHDFTPADLDKMQHAAEMHKQSGSMIFKIVEYGNNRVIIQVVQNKNSAAVYHTQKRLIEIVHETFDGFFPNMRIMVHAIPYLHRTKPGN